MTSKSDCFADGKNLNIEILAEKNPLKDCPSPNCDSGVLIESESSTPLIEEFTEARSGMAFCNGEAGKSNLSVSCNGHTPISSSHAEVDEARTASSQGPDRLAPTDDIITWLADRPVKLRIDEHGSLAEKPISVITAFRQTVERFPDHPALAYKSDGQWTRISYRDYYELVVRAAKALIQVGLEMHHGVGIIGFNSPEWFISDLAAIFAGGLSTGIYTTNSAEACQYVASNSRCNVIVVENDIQLQKILAVRKQLPHLKAIVQYKGKPKKKKVPTATLR